MPVASVVRPAHPRTDADEIIAVVVAFSRENLGRGADVSEGSRALAAVAVPDPVGSSVWLPGDPRLAE